MISAQFKELLLQSLQHERGGVLVYQTALECVVNKSLRKEWEERITPTGKLIGRCAESMDGDVAAAMTAAYEKIEDEEDEHLYHSKGWSRELWLKSLGLKAVLPPPEEQKDVKSAVEAARAKEDMEPSRKH